MGLSINYELQLPMGDFADAFGVVQQLHAAAAALARKDTKLTVHPVSTNAAELEQWATDWILLPRRDDPDTITGAPVIPIEGAIFPVSIGDDCEPLWLGLCRYPTTVDYNGQSLVAHFGGGWRYARACKTQYASLHGWDHFRRCHTTVITLLRAIVPLGGKVRITDEGGWWPHRSERILREKLEHMNRLMAGFAGALKDGLDPGVEAPILSHPQFERLEADGYTSHPLKIKAGIDRVAEELKALRKET